MTDSCKILMIFPLFNSGSFWNYKETCELTGARYPAAPLGLITVAAMLPKSWEVRLVNRNTELLVEEDFAWADMVMTGGMLPQRNDTLHIIDTCRAMGKPVVVGGPDVTSSPSVYKAAIFRFSGKLKRSWSTSFLRGETGPGRVCLKRPWARQTSQKARCRVLIR